MAEGMRVVVVCAFVDSVFRRELRLPVGATAADALADSGVLQAFPQLALAPRVGVFGREVALDAPLRDGDRVELYRPLTRDPKDARRKRARESASR